MVWPKNWPGLFLLEGSNLEVMKMTEQPVPYVLFETHPAATTKEIDELLKHMTG
jgi:hypothetical protein